MKTEFFKASAAAFAVLLSFLTAGSARAGTFKVVALPATGTDQATGITTNKHYLFAMDFGSLNGTTYNLNDGVPFAHFELAGNNVSAVTNVTDPNFGGTLTLTACDTNQPIPTRHCLLGQAANAGQGNLAAQADGNMYNLYRDMIYVTGPTPTNAWLLQDYGGLTVGHPYSLRIYYRYWGNSVGDRLQNIYFNGEGTPQAYSANPLDEDAGGPQPGGARYLEYDFTASGTDVTCLMTNLVDNGSPLIFAASLEDDSYPSGPFITFGPKVVTVGSPTVFGVSAIGTAPLAYQWYYNTVSNYSGATMDVDGNGTSGSTSTNLSTTNNLLDYYYVVVTNNYGSATSSIVQISPVPAVSQPSITNVGNAYVQYSVSAGGFPTLAYQWYYNTSSNYSGATTATGSGYSGSTTASLTATTNLQDFYFVIVTNTYGSVTSAITAYNPLPYITAQPSPFKLGSSVGFNVTAGGWPTLGYQWYYNTVSDYSGAAAMTDGGGVSGSTTTNLTFVNLANYYFVLVTNYYGSVTSSIVQLPQLTVLSAGEPIWNQTGQTNIIVTFSSMLDPTTAVLTGNYALDNGASVSSAMLAASNEVVLTTSALTPSTTYTLTVQNVSNYWGIVQTPSPANLTVGLYPANLALWVRADTGVLTDAGANTVYQWNDLSGNNNHLYQAGGANYEPLLITNAAGDVTIQFLASGGITNYMYAASSGTLGITGDMSVIAVMSFTNLSDGRSGEIVSKTGNAAQANKNVPAPYDYNMGNGGAAFLRGNGNGTVNGVNYGSVGATGGSLSSLNRSHVIAVSETGNTVSHFVDGRPAGVGLLSNGYQETNNFDGGNALFIGTRWDFFNNLKGTLSEMIIAGSAISYYDLQALDTYLATRHHFVLYETTQPSMGLAVTNNRMTLSWPLDHTGWLLQSNSVGLLATNAWFPVAGSTATNLITVTPDTTQTNVFYRMQLP